MTKKSIEERNQSCHIKSYFWFNDKKIQLVIHECISCLKNKLLVQKLTKVAGDYLGLQTIANTV